MGRGQWIEAIVVLSAKQHAAPHCGAKKRGGVKGRNSVVFLSQVNHTKTLAHILRRDVPSRGYEPNWHNVFGSY